jgi:hypothetical protein
MTQYPKFSVNGVSLSEAQNMTMWVALQSFGSEMEQPDALGTDEHGKAISKSYLQRVREINKISFETTP